MKTATACIVTLLVLTTSWSTRAQNALPTSVTVPFTLDHNRMLVDAEIERPDGSWRPVKLWVDTGNPDFIMSETLARDLGVDLSAATGNFETSAPTVRIGGMPLDFSATKCRVMFQPFWLFAATHNDANLPSTVLMHYQVVFDYPAGKLTLAAPEVWSRTVFVSARPSIRRPELSRSTCSSTATRSVWRSTTAPPTRSSPTASSPR